MENYGMKYVFTASAYRCGASADTAGWVMVSLPKEMSAKIRDGFRALEQGWGRMKVTARAGDSEWQTAIWFDTKQGTYLLPLKAAVRKKENIAIGRDVEIAIWIC